MSTNISTARGTCEVENDMLKLLVKSVDESEDGRGTSWKVNDVVELQREGDHILMKYIDLYEHDFGILKLGKD